MSSAGDVLRFYSGMADGELLSDASRAALTSDALTAQQRAAAPERVPAAVRQLGAGTGVIPETGAWGWTGGSGTTASSGPSHDTVAVLLTQRAMAGPTTGSTDFTAAVADAAAGLTSALVGAGALGEEREAGGCSAA